jgi:hypothetical protein
MHFTDGEYCIAFWNNIALVDTVGEIDVARMRQLGEAYKQLLTRYRHMAVLCVLRAGAPLSSGPARADSTKMASDLGDALARVAFVIEEGGVFAQLFRTVIRGFNQLTRTAKLTVDIELDDAVRSLAPLVITNGERANVSAELKEAFVALRTQWTPARAS